ncbi:hypothetical protein BGZ57DRAFT_875539 [Hyaloscypha finlandica]|nr:hypothetical protein BGZ57DRAFT_875539 [Hyaloscypha finlandica]
MPHFRTSLSSLVSALNTLDPHTFCPCPSSLRSQDRHNSSVITTTEHVSRYICSIIQKCQTEGIFSLSPSHAALSAYSEHIDAFMPRTTWSETCR